VRVCNGDHAVPCAPHQERRKSGGQVRSIEHGDRLPLQSTDERNVRTNARRAVLSGNAWNT
jgi:hypothetical protein